MCKRPNVLKAIFYSICCILLLTSTTQAKGKLSEVDINNLRAAIEVAAKGVADGQAPFGAVVAGPDGIILMRQENLAIRNHDSTQHAESELASRFCRQYADRPDLIKNSTLYSSVEPCAMCMFTIFSAGIGRVVYALSEEKLYNIGNQHGHWPRIHLTSRQAASFMSSPITIAGPYLEEESSAVIQHFIQQMQEKMHHKQ